MAPPSSESMREAPRFVIATDWSNATAALAALRAHACSEHASPVLVFALPHEPTEADVECVHVLLDEVPDAKVKSITLESFAEASTKSARAAVVPQGDRDVLLLEMADFVTRMHALGSADQDIDNQSTHSLGRRFQVYSEAGASAVSSEPPSAPSPSRNSPGPSLYGTYVGNGRMLATLRTGGRAYLPSDNRATTPNVLQMGLFEPELHAYIQSNVSYGGCVADVGANIGLLTIALGRAVGPVGHVFAFEPVPANLEFIRWNVETNWLMDVVEVVDKAVSSTTGATRMAVSREWNSLGSITQQRIDIAPGHVAGGQESIDVATVRLDEHVGDGTLLNLVKIDVEGAEPLVFEGMSGLFDRNAVERVAFECMREHIAGAWDSFMSTLHDFQTQGWIFGVPQLDGSVVQLPVQALDAAGALRCVVMEKPGLRAPVDAYRIRG